MNQRTPPFNNLQGAAGRQLRDQPADAGQPPRRARRADGELPAADVSAVQEDQPAGLPVQPLEGEAARPGSRGPAGMTVGVYTISDDDIDKKQGEYLASQLSKIGWKTKLHELAGANYFVIVGNQATKAQIGLDGLVRGLPVPDRLVRRSPERRATSTSSTTTTTRTSTSRTRTPRSTVSAICLRIRPSRRARRTPGPRSTRS